MVDLEAANLNKQNQPSQSQEQELVASQGPRR